MALQSGDLFLVQRGGTPFKIDYDNFKNSIGSSSVTVDETAPLNPAEGDLWWADSDVDEGGGRLYVWTGDEWVDTSLPGGGAGEFLSKTDDDTAAGAITFEELTTHEAGVHVTGGYFKKVLSDNTLENGANWIGFGTYKSGAPTTTAGNVKGFSASNLTNGTNVYGFHSDILSGPNRYTFYAAGDAPNYFAGLTQHAGGVSATGGTSIRAIFDTTTPNWGGNQSAKFYASGNSDQIGHQGFTANDIGPGADGNAVGFYYQENTANSTHNNYGFKANVFVNAGAGENYAFYSEGDAPSYFKGNVTSDGTIGFSGKFSLRMDTDDPSAFQTTYSTDEEGNQVENQEYIGTTEDLLSIIKDLRARVTQLEADHATMMNNNGGGY